MYISDKIRYVGVNDHEIDLFEGQYIVPNGMAYNSYVILDEKIAVMDTVDSRFCDAWLANLQKELGDRQPDYLIVQHMEPDHSGSVAKALAVFPNATVVASAKAFAMMKQFFGEEYADRRMVVGEGNTLSLGEHTLTFVIAPMVHWPEVLVTYEGSEKVLFSADAFGKFGALDVDEDWACEARRYYFGIVGKYGAQAQALLKKAAGLDIQTICPLHGPVLSENLSYYLDKYQLWTTYTPEDEGVTIAYASIYGNTGKAAQLLADELEKLGVKVALHDLARCDQAETVEDAFRYPKLVLAASTYNNDVFPFMKTFIHHLTERNYQNRTVALMENGTWAPNAAKVMRGLLEGCKNLNLLEDVITIRSAMNEDNKQAIAQLAQQLT
ncbi:MAG: FprA family A-type flavoprotein [Clostridia bacterium]|nr:FprA family A-type flavoprotein [Clostridia bacterium]MBP3649838.1 FprA family A-type flavoprotein [Clostridia bacterium]